MTTYEKIRERLNELIPSRLIPKVGYEFQMRGEMYYIISDNKGEYEYAYKTGGVVLDHYCGGSDPDKIYKSFFEDAGEGRNNFHEIKIFGTPPTLQEVLLAIDRDWHTAMERFISAHPDYDLTKNLKDQSEETLHKIYSLIFHLYDK